MPKPRDERRRLDEIRHAKPALRGLVDAIVMTPDEGELRIELKGNLAAMLSAATK